MKNKKNAFLSILGFVTAVAGIGAVVFAFLKRRSEIIGEELDFDDEDYFDDQDQDDQEMVDDDTVELIKVDDNEVKLAYVEQIMLKKMTPPQVAKELGLNDGTVCD
jgi:hypothetical protein